MSTATFLHLCLTAALLAPLLAAMLTALLGRRLQHILPPLQRFAAPRQRPQRRYLAGLSAQPPATRRVPQTPPAPGEPHAAWLTCAGIALALAASFVALIVWTASPADARAALGADVASGAWTWLRVDTLVVDLSLRLDGLSLAMCLMVCACALGISVFSIGYLRGDGGYVRYFALLALFCGAMLGLCLFDNLLLLLVSWEVMGVCSYLLIGFWHTRPAARAAATKAFLVTRIGDVGLIAAVGLCGAAFGTLSVRDMSPLMQAAAQQAGVEVQPLAPSAAQAPSSRVRQAARLFETQVLGVSLATWLGLAFILAALGKSAQIPLHVWLPDAMAGPTPVSALIHAATMVAAGVYLLARVHPLLTPAALSVLAALGAATLLLGAVLACVQWDIKRVLAYSTISQLGYMMLGLGMGAWVGATFHLLTHGFFKALLFLAAGQVIAACHHEQDLRRFGGLLRVLPRAAAAFAVGALALSAVGIPWTPLGLGGFFSKDEIIAVTAWRWSTAADAAAVWGSGALLLAALTAAALTPLYIGRCFMMTFLGPPPAAARGRAVGSEHPLMAAALVGLGLLTIVSGWFLFRALTAQAAPLGAGLTALVDGHDKRLHGVHVWLPPLTTLLWAGGLSAAFWLAARPALPAPVVAARQRWTAALRGGLGFDAAYAVCVVNPLLRLTRLARWVDEQIVNGAAHVLAYLVRRFSRAVGRGFDELVVDGAVEGTARAARLTGDALARVQTGRIRGYVALLACGLAALTLSLWQPWLGAPLLAGAAAWLSGGGLLLIALAVGSALLVLVQSGGAGWAAALLLSMVVLVVLGRRGMRPATD